MSANNNKHLIISTGPSSDYEDVLSSDAQAFLARLTRTFRPRIDELLAMRAERRAAWARGVRLGFLEETAGIRAASWQVPPPPHDLNRRAVEITGPVDRKMIINALNSGADVFMADFEDSTSPTWSNILDGQRNLFDAVRRTIRYRDAQRGKEYALNPETATLVVRPRGLHLTERHLFVDEKPLPAALVDFGLYVFHNARELLSRGSGPYFYLPKLESHLEARWWRDAFVHCEDVLGIPRGTIRATVLIETLPAAFEMEEILWELRHHSCGLNCGRWDYIFSFIKCHAADPQRLLPDRGQVTMEQPFMRAYTRLVVKTCHRRGAHAIGGMAAQIPIKDDPVSNQEALDKVRGDKLREVQDGHDGTWVAHPGLVSVARQVFDEHMHAPNQIERQLDDLDAGAEELLAQPDGTRTEGGLRHNVRVGILYLEAWLRGVGCVPIDHLMEDTATAEICRTQAWQWLRHGAVLADGRVVDRDLFEQVLEDVTLAIATEVGEAGMRDGRFNEARDLFAGLCTGDELVEFLTLEASKKLNH